MFAILAALLLAAPPAPRPAPSPASGCNLPAAAPVTMFSLRGEPFEPIPSPDGCWIFVSLADQRAIGVYRRDRGNLSLARVVALPGAPAAMVLTHDGKLLIAALPGANSVAFLDAGRLAPGGGAPLLGVLGADRFPGAVYANVTADDALLFVSDESARAITVVDLAQARSHDFAASAIIGDIPSGNAPVALVFSPDGRYLYATSEVAPRFGVDAACLAESGSRAIPPGMVQVIDVERARTAPASAVIAAAPAGCSPVRLELSADGATAFVTARGENAVLALDTAKLLSDPLHALLARIRVGSAPVGIVLVPGGQLIVANSDRFAGGRHQTLTVLNADWHTWSKPSAVLGQIPAGAFPRELRLTADGRTLLAANFGSKQLELVDLAQLRATFQTHPH